MVLAGHFVVLVATHRVHGREADLVYLQPHAFNVLCLGQNLVAKRDHERPCDTVPRITIARVGHPWS